MCAIRSCKRVQNIWAQGSSGGDCGSWLLENGLRVKMENSAASQGFMIRCLFSFLQSFIFVNFQTPEVDHLSHPSSISPWPLEHSKPMIMFCHFHSGLRQWKQKLQWIWCRPLVIKYSPSGFLWTVNLEIKGSGLGRASLNTEYK